MSSNEIIQNTNIVKILPLAVIFLIGIGYRMYYFPYELPLITDSLDYFSYATESVFLGHLPNTWTPINNGWPMFLSFWFSIVNLENTFEYMQFQRIISLSLSALTVIPVYFLCKKFFNTKLALIGASIFIFDPRIVLNSLLGIADPLFILLSVTALLIFLKYERKTTIFSFTLVAFTTIVRSEGIFLLLALTILFFIKYKFSKEIFKTYFPAVLIFMLILIPIMEYRIDITGTDGIFLRVAQGTAQTISPIENNGIMKFVDAGQLFFNYLGWIMIPTFIVFLPFGIIQFLRKRQKETNFIIVILIISSIPIFYAYSVQAQDTRYLYVLYPIFSLISLFAVQSYISKTSRKDTVTILIIVGILCASIGFYEFKKIDYEKEKELYEIGKIISETASGINTNPHESRYARIAEIPEQWPFTFHDNMYQIKIISTNGYENLHEYIQNSEDKLTHIVVDNDPNLPEFLKDVNTNENKYNYLKKVYDSKNDGFKHQVKIFEIDWESFNSIRTK